MMPLTAQDIHTTCFRAGLLGEAMPPALVGHAYAEMAYRDGCEERQRHAVHLVQPRGEQLTDWSAA